MAVTDRLAAVRREIERACGLCGRDPATVELLAVSKGHPASAIAEAAAAGQVSFGENRVQELTAKSAELEDTELSWHMIGSLQTNKVRDVLRVTRLALLHTLDRQKLADHLQTSLESDARELSVLLQANASGEVQKHGVAMADALTLGRHLASACPRLSLRGVMAMGPLEGDPAPAFARAARLREELRDALGLELPVLSLGMTRDLEPAIAAGSTLVRVGTGVFGPRTSRAT